MGFPVQNLHTELATKDFIKKKLRPIISLCFPGLESIFNLKNIKQKVKRKKKPLSLCCGQPVVLNLIMFLFIKIG